MVATRAPGPRRLLGRLLASVLVLGPSLLAVPAMAATRAGGPLPAEDLPAPASGVWPLQPRPAVVKGFDPPAERWNSGHRGVDLAGHVGEPVHAALAGRVTFAGRLAGVGVVVVDHGGTRTTYEPVTASVHVGDRVSTGGVIGHLALFGSHCFPRACLHWGLIEGRDHYLDPLLLVGAAPVILLPVGPPPAVRAPAPRRLVPQGSEAGRTSAADSGQGPVRPGSLTEPLRDLGWP